MAKSRAKWSGKEVEAEREKSDACVCVSFNPFSPHTPSQGENIPSNASLLVLVWLSEGFFYQLTFFPPTLFSQFRPLADWMKKNPRRRQTVCWKKKIILETFVGEKEEEQEKHFILYFILPQETETPERVKPLNRQDVQIFSKRERRNFTLSFLHQGKNIFWEKELI